MQPFHSWIVSKILALGMVGMTGSKLRGSVTDLAFSEKFKLKYCSMRCIRYGDAEGISSVFEDGNIAGIEAGR